MKKIVLLISVMSIFFINGCGIKGNVDIRIVEVGSMLRYDVSPRGIYRETILSINEDKKCFYTLQQFGNKMLKLRTRDFKGKETRLQTMPLFSQFYYYPGNTVSPDGRNFVYLDRKDRSIKVYNLDSKTNNTLLADAAAYCINVMMMEFISNDTMIIALDEDEEVGRRECQIIRYNIASKTHEILVKPVKLSHKYSFSDSKKYLAFWEGREKHSIYGEIKLLDISKGEIIAAIKSITENSLLSCPCWSPDGNKIGYVEGKSIKVFSLDSKKSITVKNFSEDLLCYELKFTDNEHLICELGDSEYSPISQPLQVIEISTGRDVKKIENFESNGDLFVVEKGERIIGEVGF